MLAIHIHDDERVCYIGIVLTTGDLFCAACNDCVYAVQLEQKRREADNAHRQFMHLPLTHSWAPNDQVTLHTHVRTRITGDRTFVQHVGHGRRTSTNALTRHGTRARSAWSAQSGQHVLHELHSTSTHAYTTTSRLLH
jgi:hypothetical protein